MAQELKSTVSSDGFGLKFSEGTTVEQIQAAQNTLSQLGSERLPPVAQEKAIRGLKFSECLSPRLANQVASARLRDDEAVTSVLREVIHVTLDSDNENLKPSLGKRRYNQSAPENPAPNE